MSTTRLEVLVRAAVRAMTVPYRPDKQTATVALLLTVGR